VASGLCPIRRQLLGTRGFLARAAHRPQLLVLVISEGDQFGAGPDGSKNAMTKRPFQTAIRRRITRDHDDQIGGLEVRREAKLRCLFVLVVMLELGRVLFELT